MNRSTFLNITSGTPLSNAAKAAVDRLIEAQWTGTGTREERYALMGSARERFAQLIRARASEIAVTKNVTEGLNIVASAIDWKPGDNVVVCAELEHPNNIYLWLTLRERGVQVRAIPAKDGAIDTVSPQAGVPDTRIGHSYPNPLEIPSGCAFHPRCPRAMPVCSTTTPTVIEMPQALVRCHLYSDAQAKCA